MYTLRIDQALERLKSVFADPSVAALSAVDAALLVGIDRETCRLLLEALADTRMLARSPDGRYRAAHSIAWSDPPLR